MSWSVCLNVFCMYWLNFGWGWVGICVFGRWLGRVACHCGWKCFVGFSAGEVICFVGSRNGGYWSCVCWVWIVAWQCSVGIGSSFVKLCRRWTFLVVRSCIRWGADSVQAYIVTVVAWWDVEGVSYSLCWAVVSGRRTAYRALDCVERQCRDTSS